MGNDVVGSPLVDADAVEAVTGSDDDVVVVDVAGSDETRRAVK